MYKLTYPSNLSFCEKITDNINKDNPNYPAKIMYNENTELGYVVLEEEYWQKCKEYVLNHCKTKKGQ